MLVNLAFPRKSDPELLFNIFDFTYDIYSKCQQWGVKKIINISSQSVYDRKRMTPAKETDLVKPFSLYGLGKKYVEDWTSEFSQKNGLKYINLRLGSVIGPEFHARILNRLCKQAMETHDLQIKESEIQFSFIYIEDVIDSLIASLEIADQDWNEIYNVGAATAVTLTEVAQEIARQLSEEVKIDIEVKPAVKTTNQVDISKFQKATNWVPAYDLEKIIEGILDFYGK